MESKTPQLEDGYTTIANEIIDNFQSLYLSANEWKVLWVVIRKTYGWKKKEDRISITQFQKATGLSRPSAHQAIKSLVAKHLIVAKPLPFGIIYSFNKTHSEWTSSYTANSRGFTTTLVAKPLTKLVAKPLHTKEKKTTITKESSINTTAPAEIPRNKDIDFILDTYKKYMGFYPTDRKPRQVAQNIKQITNSFIKRNADKKVFVFEEIIEKAFKWYMDRDELKGETLDVFKRKMRILFDKTETKLRGGEQA